MTYNYPQLLNNKADFNSNAISLDFSPYFKFTVPVPCSDCRKYLLPFTNSDKFFFQFNDEVATVEVIDASTDLPITPNGVEMIGNQFSIDFSQIDSEYDCIYLIVNGDCRLEHEYTKKLCKSTVLVEGVFDEGKTDLLGNEYKNGYSNRIRFYGDLEFVAEEIKTEENNGKVISTSTRSVYDLSIQHLLKEDYWALNHLIKTVLRAKSIRVDFDEKTYFYSSLDESVEKNNETGKEWVPVIKLKTEEETQDLIC